MGDGEKQYKIKGDPRNDLTGFSFKIFWIVSHRSLKAPNLLR